MHHKSGQSGTTTPSFRAAFNFICLWWLFIFVLFLIPLDFLYRFVSLFEMPSLLQFGASLVSLVFLFALVSCGIALTSLLAAMVLRLFTSQAAGPIQAINVFGGLWFLLMMLLAYYWRWFIKLLSFNWTLMNAGGAALVCVLLALLIVGLLFRYKKAALFTKINVIVAKSCPYTLVVVGLCTLGTLAFISSNLYLRYHEGSPPISAAHPVSKPNIIIVTFDALNAQHTSVYGHPRNTTPNFQALAQESFVFDNAYAVANFTPPTTASIMTGKYPFNHHILSDYFYYIGKGKTENLAFLLRGLGYQTFGVAANQFVGPYQRNQDGFDEVSLCFSQSRLLALVSKYCYLSGLGSAAWLFPLLRENPLVLAGKSLHHWWRTWFHNPGALAEDDRSLGVYAPEYTFGEATRLIQGSREPFFMWVHLIPPHDPYVPSKQFLYTFLPEKIFDGPGVFASDLAPEGSYPPQDQPKVDKLALRYDEHILYADHEFGKFIGWLRQQGLLDRSILMVSSDHGEMFEKGFCSHCGPFLYQPLIHIPFILRLPRQTRGQRLAVNISQVDIAPTLLDYLGVPAPPWMDGQSFKNALTGLPYQPNPKFSMNLSLKGAPPEFLTRSIAVIKDHHKLIHYLNIQRDELYDLQKDPGELHNLVGREPEIFASLKQQLDGILLKSRAH